MLEQIGAAPGHKSDLDWPQLWIDSEERKQVRRDLDVMVEELPKLTQVASLGPAGKSDAHASFATPLWFQTALVTRRAFEQYWRTPSTLR